MLSKNIDHMIAETERHLREDRVRQGHYWILFQEKFRGCFIGCLTHKPFPDFKTLTDLYGLPSGLIATLETIFELQPTLVDARAFFRNIPYAIAVDGKDLSQVYECYNEQMNLWYNMPDGLFNRVIEVRTDTILRCLRDAPMGGEDATA